MTLTAKVKTGKGQEFTPCKVKGDGWAITRPVYEEGDGPACGYWLTHESSGMAFRVNARDLASLEMAREYLVTCGLNWRMAANRVKGSRIHCEALRHACEIAGDSTYADTMTQYITKKWGFK